MKKALAITAAAVCVLAALAALNGSARATYRGKANGRLAFGININGNTDVYSVQPDGQDLQRLTTDPGFDACAAYSADGHRIAYCSGQGGGPVQVWTMNQDGTDKQQVTHMSVTAIFPDFSPDGGKIVFCAGASTFTRDIYVVNSDGTDLTRLTSGVGNNVYPAFSPNGRKIVFTSNRTGTSQVWLMNADGSNQRQLTFDSQPKDQVPDWSPNGSKIAYAGGFVGKGLRELLVGIEVNQLSWRWFSLGFHRSTYQRAVVAGSLHARDGATVELEERNSVRVPSGITDRRVRIVVGEIVVDGRDISKETTGEVNAGLIQITH